MINITINTDNAAFQSEDPSYDARTREILRMLKTADFYDGSTLFDSNGNAVGKVTVTEDE